MSSFPPSKWEVRFLKDMDTYEGSSNENHDLSMEALMALRPSEGEEGNFRFVLAGPNIMRLSTPVNSILAGEEFKGMRIEAQMGVGDQLKLEKNSVCTKWMDIVELVQSQDVEIVNDQGEDVSESFLALMEIYRKEDRPQNSGNFKELLQTYLCQKYTVLLIYSDFPGICMRWLLGTLVGNTQVLLIAQALPCSKAVIDANPSLQTDHTRGVLVDKFPILYELFNDEEVSGPIPVFFSNNPNQTLAALKKDPDFAFHCLQQLVARLLVRSELTR